MPESVSTVPSGPRGGWRRSGAGAEYKEQSRKTSGGAALRVGHEQQARRQGQGHRNAGKKAMPPAVIAVGGNEPDGYPAVNAATEGGRAMRGLP